MREFNIWTLKYDSDVKDDILERSIDILGNFVLLPIIATLAPSSNRLFVERVIFNLRAVFSHSIGFNEKLMEKGYKRAELEYFLQHHKSYR